MKNIFYRTIVAVKARIENVILKLLKAIEQSQKLSHIKPYFFCQLVLFLVASNGVSSFKFR